MPRLSSDEGVNMTINDGISDMLVRLRQGLHAQKDAVEMPHSKLKEAVTRVLKDEGYILGYENLSKGTKKILRIWFKVRPDGKKVIRQLKRISTSGCRRYLGYKRLFSPMLGFGTLILSTPKGVMTERQARRIKVGGEVLCRVA
jgi:small subunit ribosomal protein S8